MCGMTVKFNLLLNIAPEYTDDESSLVAQKILLERFKRYLGCVSHLSTVALGDKAVKLKGQPPKNLRFSHIYANRKVEFSESLHAGRSFPKAPDFVI